VDMVFDSPPPENQSSIGLGGLGGLGGHNYII